MAWSCGDNPLCFNGFNDPSRRKHRHRLDPEVSHSNKEKIMRAESRLSGLGEWTEASLQHRPFHPFLTLPNTQKPWIHTGWTLEGLPGSMYSLHRGGKKNPEKASHLPKATQLILKAECGVKEKHLWQRRETWFRSHLNSAREAAPCISAPPSSPGRDCMTLQSLLIPPHSDIIITDA